MYRLSEEAADDLLGILAHTADRYGIAAARRLEARLKARFAAIAAGIALGHQRSDISAELRLRFVTERPFVVAFDPETRIIIRILHGARDFPSLFD